MAKDNQDKEDKDSDKEDEDSDEEYEEVEENPWQASHFEESFVNGSVDFVAPVLEAQEQAFQEDLEQTAETAPSTAIADDANTGYSSSSNKDYSLSTDYEADKGYNLGEKRDSRDVMRRDLFLESREDISSSSIQDNPRRTHFQQDFSQSSNRRDIMDFQTQVRKYEEKLEEKSTPAFRRKEKRQEIR